MDDDFKQHVNSMAKLMDSAKSTFATRAQVMKLYYDAMLTVGFEPSQALMLTAAYFPETLAAKPNQ